MRRFLLLLIGLFYTVQSFAQDPAIYGTWYLTELTGDLGVSTYVDDVSPRIDPIITIEPDLTYSGTAACNDYFGNFGYDAVDDVLLLQSFDATLSLCNFPEHDNFESIYFSYFDGTEYSYYVGNSGNGSYLILEPVLGYQMIYQNTPLSVSENELARFIVYPNPTEDLLFIASKNISIESIVIYDINGGQVLSETAASQVDVSVLTNGVYFIEILAAKGRSVQRFVKL